MILPAFKYAKMKWVVGRGRAARVIDVLPPPRKLRHRPAGAVEGVAEAAAREAEGTLVPGPVTLSIQGGNYGVSRAWMPKSVWDNGCGRTLTGLYAHYLARSPVFNTVKMAWVVGCVCTPAEPVACAGPPRGR